MNLTPYVEEIRSQLLASAEAGGEEARELADRLSAPLEAAVRLALQDVLAAAVEEITVDLAPGSVELRLRGREPEFVVTPAPSEAAAAGAAERAEEEGGWGAMLAAGEGDEGGMTRINLRLPDHLKTRIEAAASAEALSINAWLLRAVARALERNEPDRASARRAATGGQRYTGWGR